MDGENKYISAEEWQMIDEKKRQEISKLIKDKQKENDSFRRLNVPDTFYVKYGKRILDILIGGSAFILTIPINLIIAVITWFDVGSPILFRQERIGKDGKTFQLVKFRNMTNETNEQGILLPPGKRVTKWGKFARRTSLDELLNLWNVVKGEMSIIGPRPLPQKYYDRFNEYHRQRHMVFPGLECPFHDDGGGKKGWGRRLDNDIWYVENISFATDVRMFFLLIKKVLSKEERIVSSAGMQSELIGYDESGDIITEENIPRKYLDLYQNRSLK